MVNTGTTAGKPARGSEYRVVVGLGKTGFSLARFLRSAGLAFYAVDTREQPPLLAEFQREFPGVYVETGVIDSQLMAGAHEILVSPGVAPDESFFCAAKEKHVPLIGDIEMFFRHAHAPIVAITGSNAKSTVTTLVGEMVRASGLRVAVGGNLGTPALELLDESVQLYVLELSSFQLELVSAFAPKVAAFLNVSEDHMDRYPSLAAYTEAKRNIFTHCTTAVYNAQDIYTRPVNNPACQQITFSLDEPAANHFGLRRQAGITYLAKGHELLLDVRELKLFGLHNIANCLAALAIGEAAGLPIPVMCSVLKTFAGLPHRCQWVADAQGVRYINDSKGTNVGATLAAIEGLGIEDRKNLVLIAGGEGKGADFAPLAPACARSVKACVLIGRDARLIANAISHVTETVYALDMASAVKAASNLARQGDTVLLSPACASFDMFRNYEHRGECFVAAVKELVA